MHYSIQVLVWTHYSNQFCLIHTLFSNATIFLVNSKHLCMFLFSYSQNLVGFKLLKHVNVTQILNIAVFIYCLMFEFTYIPAIWIFKFVFVSLESWVEIHCTARCNCSNNTYIQIKWKTCRCYTVHVNISRENQLGNNIF